MTQDYLLHPTPTKEKKRLQNQLEALRNGLLGTNADILAGKSSTPFNCTLEPGDICTILTGRSKGKDVTVLRYEPKFPDTLWVNDGKKREISFHRSELGLIRRAGDANG